MAIVRGHQMCPGIGMVALVAVDGGGLDGSVCAKREVEVCIFGAARFKGPDANRPALLTQ